MTMVKIEKILPNPEQPRQVFDQAELEGLAASIRQDGVIEPVVVEEAGDQFILHDGERRVRAARMAGLIEIPAHVTPPINGKGGEDRLARALVANLQRSDLNPIEEAKAYYRLRRTYGFSYLQIAERVGSQEHRIYTRLKLLQLDGEIQDLMARKEFVTDPRVVKAIQSIGDKKARIDLARKAAKGRYRINEIVLAAKRVNQALENVRTGMNEKSQGLEMGLARSKRPLDLPKWNALAQVGRVPQWDLVEKYANLTCRQCSLCCMASKETCQECPLPVFLKNLIEAAMKLIIVNSKSNR